MFEAYSSVDNVFNLPFEIGPIACLKSSQSILSGDKDGNLFVYSPGRRGLSMDHCSKNVRKKAISQMHICEKEELLFCVSDGLLSAHNLSHPDKPAIIVYMKIKPIQNVLPIYPKNNQSLYLLITSKKRFSLLKWENEEFKEIRLDYNHSFSENPANMRVCRDSIAFSVKDEYFWMKLTESPIGVDSGEECWEGTVVRLFNTTDTPIIVDIHDKELMGFGIGESVVFRDTSGNKSPTFADIKFTETPRSLVYDRPFIISLGKQGRIEVRSLSPSILIQSIVISKAHTLCGGISGKFYVACNTQLIIMDCSKNLPKIVDALISERYFELAIQLAETSSSFSDDCKRDIKTQAATNLFYQHKFEECFNIHIQIKSDVTAIIQFFPEFLPEKYRNPNLNFDLSANDKKRALLALGNCLSEMRADYTKRLDQYQKSGSVPIEAAREELEQLLNELQIIDTTLLKCYLKTKPMLVDSLLRLQNNSCCFDDAESILKSENRLSSLFILYESRKKHEMALNLLFTQMENPQSEPFFKGPYRLIEYLQSLGNTHLELIFHYAKPILAKDVKEGLSIFIGEESDAAHFLDREKILEFLVHNCVSAVIPYLEHVVYNWKDSRAQFHQTLAEYYVMKVKELRRDYVHILRDEDIIEKAGEEDGDLGIYRRKLLHFLTFSMDYSAQSILMQLNKYPFYEEKAIILGRLKQHEQALAIHTSILSNFEEAERYCALYYDKKDDLNSQVYIHWFRAYLVPPDPSVAGLLEEELEIPPPDVHSAIKVLSLHADRIDTMTALSLLPADTPLCVLSHALNAVLQTVHNDSTAYSMRRSICEKALEKAEKNLKQAENTRVSLGNTTECKKCNKKLGLCTFFRNPADGALTHAGCSEQ